MTAKLVLVLGYLSLIAVTFVSWPVIHDVCTGFFRVGTVPLRAETIILERDFTVREDRGATAYVARGTWEKDGKPTGDFSVTTGTRVARFDLRKNDKLTPEQRVIRDHLLERSRELATPRGSSSRPERAHDASGRRHDRQLSLMESIASFAQRFERHAQLFRRCQRPGPVRRSLSQPARARRRRVRRFAELRP